jgi:hypothetical protein
MSFQEFQKAPNKLNARDIGFLLLAAVIIVLVIAALAVGNYYLANLLPDGGEFYLLRTGGRAFLFDRIEPFSGSVPSRVQEKVYGRSAMPGEDVYILDIPFNLLILFFPLALIPDVLIARTVWMALTEIAMLGLIFFSFRLYDRRVPYFFIVLITIAGLISFYAFRAFLEGSPAVILSIAYVGILISLRAGLDELAGALMMLSSFLWELGGPFLLFIVLWVFWERRWRVFIGAAMLGSVLLVISFFLYPGWVLPFMRAAWNSFRVGYGYSVHTILVHLWPDFGSTIGWVLTVVLLILLGYAWNEARGASHRRFIWAICLTLAITPLLGFHVELDQLVLLTLPIMMIVLVSRDRWRKFGSTVAILLLAFFFGVPWLLVMQGVPQGFDLSVDEVLFLFWPASSLIGLYWMRWWMIRPPRTWLDQVGKMEHQ